MRSADFALALSVSTSVLSAVIWSFALVSSSAAVAAEVSDCLAVARSRESWSRCSVSSPLASVRVSLSLVSAAIS
jgi:hypothetical protein